MAEMEGRTAVTAVPDVVAPPPRHPRFALMEGLRAIAVLSVIAVHAAEVSNEFSVPVLGPILARMNVGVTIFFLISGFLLYRPMIAWRGNGPPAPAASQYLKRRFLRIFPAYWTTLTVLLIFTPALGRVNYGGVWIMYGLVHTLGLTHGLTCVNYPYTCGLAQTWSLVAELTFYLALPAFALLLSAVTRRLSLGGWLAAQLGVLATLSAASVILQFVVLSRAPAAFGYSVGGYALWFGLGMAMAVLSVWEAGRPSRAGALGAVRRHPQLAWLAAAALYALACVGLPASPLLFVRHQVLEAHVLYAFIAAALLLPAVFDGGTGAPRRLLSARAMRWLGTVSYGIFLWHYVIVLKLGPLGAHASFVVVLLGSTGGSVLCAAASYYVLERPILRLKYRTLRPRSFAPGKSTRTPSATPAPPAARAAPSGRAARRNR